MLRFLGPCDYCVGMERLLPGPGGCHDICRPQLHDCTNLFISGAGHVYLQCAWLEQDSIEQPADNIDSMRCTHWTLVWLMLA